MYYISVEGEDYHFGLFYLVCLNRCFGHNRVLGGSHIQNYFVLKGSYWLNCVLKSSINLS